MSLGPTHDTLGVMTRSLELLTRVTSLLLEPFEQAEQVGGLVVPEDLWSVADPAVSAALEPTLARLADLLPVTRLETLVPGHSPVSLAQMFTVTQGVQVWQTFGDWVSTANPELGPDVRARMLAASQLDPAEVAVAQQQAKAVREHLAESLQGKVILMPTVPVTAPTPEDARTPDVRGRLLSMTVLASIGRLPGLTVPVEGPGGLPVGLCLVGAPGSDEQLLALAASL